MPDLVRHATLSLSSADVLRFLGRKLHPSLAAEVLTDAKRRPEGWRVKHRLARNWVKVYDKASVLRVETTINNPREFRTLRVITDDDGRRERRWCPMNKGVSNMWRYFQVGIGANRRYLEALAAAPPNGEGVAALDALCRSRTRNGRHHARFNPLQPADLALFRAVLAGGNTIVGFRNHDLVHRLYPTPSHQTTTNADDDAPAAPDSSPNCAVTASSPRSAAPASTASPHTANVSSPPPSPSTTNTSPPPTSPPDTSTSPDRANPRRKSLTASPRSRSVDTQPHEIPAPGFVRSDELSTLRLRARALRGAYVTNATKITTPFLVEAGAQMAGPIAGAIVKGVWELRAARIKAIADAETRTRRQRSRTSRLRMMRCWHSRRRHPTSC